MLWVAIPFLILYLITPFFLKLVPLKNNNRLDFDSFESEIDDETKSMDKLDDGTRIMSRLKVTDDDELFDISDIDL